MAKIPVRDELAYELDHPRIEEMPRHYLGMSMIGDPCDRYLQLYFRWAGTITLDRRIRRLFDFGHIAEKQMTAELERIGCKIYEQQAEYVGFAGHWKGHSDGKITQVPGHYDKKLLLEYKTHNAKFFKQLQKEGVKKGFTKHYDQCQRYLAAEPDLDGIMYIGYSKNDSEYHIEFIPRDESRAKELKSREQHIMFAESLSPRIGTGQITWHECLFCNFKKQCFERKPIMESCRSCKNVEVRDAGVFYCSHWGHDLTLEEQKDGCDDYNFDNEFFDRAKTVSE